MGRASQFINYINADKAPNKKEKQTIYTHIDINDNTKQLRRNYRSLIRNQRGTPSPQMSLIKL